MLCCADLQLIEGNGMILLGCRQCYI